MKIRLSVLALCVLLLAGCQAGLEEPPGAGASADGEEASSAQLEPVSKTPQELLEEQPIDDTHNAFLVDTGGRMDTLLVTVELGTERGEFEVSMSISVWDPADMSQPLQSMETETTVFGEKEIVDINFDGYPDMTYLFSRGIQVERYQCWLWDEEQGLFVELPVYAEIPSPHVDPATETISGWYRASALGDGTSTFHRWVDGKLVCMRKIEVYKTGGFNGPFLLTVEDRIDGGLVEIFHTEFPEGSDGYFDERSRWADLDYHGEPGGLYDTLTELLAEHQYPDDDTRDAFLVDTGGRMGTLLVAEELLPREGSGELGYYLRLSIWDPAAPERPLQVHEIDWETAYYGEHQVLDVNFDGYQDFTCLYARGVQVSMCHCMRWDEEQGQFVEVPAYAEIPSPYVDPATETITGWSRSSGAGDGTTPIYQWVDGELVCVRKIETFPKDWRDYDSPYVLTVEERIDGELTEVYRVEFPADSGGYITEQMKWEDLDYHGEENNQISS